MKDIHATIGILTYNSAENLARCLESIKNFSEIIVADGGSTDATLEIARAAGARIISQSNPGHSITNFALERNRLLKAATEPWFFYLDSDEIMSPELVKHIRIIANDQMHPYGAYRVRYLKTNADASKIYRTFKEYYQIRLVRTDVGAHFERPVHEHIIVPPGISVGQTETPWYVPLDAGDLSLRIVIPKIWKRTGMEAKEWQSNGVKDIFLRILGMPCIRIAKSLAKIVLVKLRWGKVSIPVRYEVIRIIYTCFFSLRHVQRLIHV